MAAYFDARTNDSYPLNAPPSIPTDAPFLNVQRIPVKAIVVGVVFYTIATASVAIRAYVKSCIAKEILLEDYICASGFAFATTQFASLMLAYTSGIAGPHELDATLAHLYSFPNLISSWMAITFATPALGLVKLTFLIQYWRVFRPFRWVRVACATVGGSAMAFYAGVTITNFILCSPWPGESWVAGLNSRHFGYSEKLSIPIGAVGAAFDIFLLVLPIRAVSQLQMPKNRKIGLSLIFLAGSLASIASIMSLVYRVETSSPNAHSHGPNANDVNILIWLLIELYVGISCSCMPSFTKLVSTQRTGRKAAGFARLRSISFLRFFSRGRRGSTASNGPMQTHLVRGEDAGLPQAEKFGHFEEIQMQDVSNHEISVHGGTDSTDGGIHLIREFSVSKQPADNSELRPPGIDRRWE